jgi:hypothetical protein
LLEAVLVVAVTEIFAHGSTMLIFWGGAADVL